MLRSVAIAVVCLAAAAAHADEVPYGLVIGYDGDPNPAIEVNAEILSGTDITIGNAALSVYSYRLCQAARFVGGRVSFTALYAKPNADGNVEMLGTRLCPNEIRFALNGGMMIKTVEIGALPDCVVVGKRRRDIGAIQISAGDKPVVTLPVLENVVAVPPNYPPLANGEYKLTILDRDMKPLKSLPAKVTEEVAAKKCVIRVN